MGHRVLLKNTTGIPFFHGVKTPGSNLLKTPRKSAKSWAEHLGKQGGVIPHITRSEPVIF